MTEDERFELIWFYRFRNEEAAYYARRQPAHKTAAAGAIAEARADLLKGMGELRKSKAVAPDYWQGRHRGGTKRKRPDAAAVTSDTSATNLPARREHPRSAAGPQETKP